MLTSFFFQTARDVNHDIFACFDYQKAFGRVQYDKLIEVLEVVGIDNQDSNYWQSLTTTIRI